MTARWSPQVVSDLRALVDEGYSASIAASQFSGMTRNAALGLAFRNDFHFHGTICMEPPVKVYTAAPVVVSMASEIMSDTITIEELQPDSCRWIGAVRDRYCGQIALESKPYCSHHCRLAYQPRVK